MPGKETEDLQVIITPAENRLVCRIAGKVYKKYCPAGASGSLTRDDLKHHGLVGLIEAKSNYNKSIGVPWLNFAAYRVRGSMMDAIRKIPLIRLPQEKQQMVKAVKTAREDLIRAGKETGAAAIAEFLDWRIDQVELVQNLSPALVSIDAHPYRGNTENSPQGLDLEDPGQNPEQAHVRKILQDTIQTCMQKIQPPKYRFVFVARIIEEVTLADIAKTYNKSIETIRQWQRRAQKQMVDCLIRNGWSVDD